MLYIGEREGAKAGRHLRDAAQVASSMPSPPILMARPVWIDGEFVLTQCKSNTCICTQVYV